MIILENQYVVKLERLKCKIWEYSLDCQGNKNSEMLDIQKVFSKRIPLDELSATEYET